MTNVRIGYQTPKLCYFCLNYLYKITNMYLKYVHTCLPDCMLSFWRDGINNVETVKRRCIISWSCHWRTIVFTQAQDCVQVDQLLGDCQWMFVIEISEVPVSQHTPLWLEWSLHSATKRNWFTTKLGYKEHSVITKKDFSPDWWFTQIPVIRNPGYN